MNESVNVSERLLLQRVQKPDDRVLKLGAVSTSEMLHGLGRVVHNGRRVGTQSEDKLAEVDEILSLEIGHSALSIELDDIKHSTGVDAKAVPSREKNLARLENPSSKTIIVNSLHGIGDLGHVAPENLLRDVGIVAWRESIAETHVSGTQVLLRQCLGERVIVSDKDQRAILEAAASECIVHSDHAAIANAFPGLDRANRLLICETEACSC